MLLEWTIDLILLKTHIAVAGTQIASLIAAPLRYITWLVPRQQLGDICDENRTRFEGQDREFGSDDRSQLGATRHECVAGLGGIETVDRRESGSFVQPDDDQPASTIGEGTEGLEQRLSDLAFDLDLLSVSAYYPQLFDQRDQFSGFQPSLLTSHLT